MNMVMHRPTVPLFSARWDSRPARRSGRGFLSSRSFYACEDQFGYSHLDEKPFWGFGPSWCVFLPPQKPGKNRGTKNNRRPKRDPNGLCFLHWTYFLLPFPPGVSVSMPLYNCLRKRCLEEYLDDFRCM